MYASLSEQHQAVREQNRQMGELNRNNLDKALNQEKAKHLVEAQDKLALFEKEKKDAADRGNREREALALKLDSQKEQNNELLNQARDLHVQLDTQTKQAEALEKQLDSQV